MSGKVAHALRDLLLLGILVALSACGGPGAVGAKAGRHVEGPRLQTGTYIPRPATSPEPADAARKKEQARKKKKKDRAAERKVDTDFKPRGGFR